MSPKLCLRLVLSAAILALLPATAIADCGAAHKVKQSMSCAHGTAWDAATQRCELQSSS